jgi:hypothetical protein
MTQSNIANTEISAAKKQDWHLKPPVEIKEKRFYSADEVINAYFLGVDKGYSKAKIEYNNNNERFKILFKTFEDNLNIAKQTCEKFLGEICKNGFKSLGVWLRSYSLTSFDAIFVIDKKDFVNEEFLAIYTLSQEIREKVNNNSFNISLTFMPNSNHLNEDKLLADGYVLNYGRIQKH